jgi:hypothetical protein
MRKSSVLAPFAFVLLFFLVSVRMAPAIEDAGCALAGENGMVTHSHQHSDKGEGGENGEAVVRAAIRGILPQGTSVSVQEMMEVHQWKILYVMPISPHQKARYQFLKKPELSLLGARKG